MTLLPKRISVVGLGYVGLPLAIAFAKHFQVTGFDIKPGRVKAIHDCHDTTGEVSSEDLASTRASFTSDPNAMRGSDLFVITVPTPVTKDNQPDLTAVRSACTTVGKIIAKGATVVLEPLTDFVAILESAIGRKAQIRSGPMQMGDVSETFADIEDSRRDLDFHPVTTIRDGLPRFVEWYRAFYGNADSAPDMHSTYAIRRD